MCTTRMYDVAKTKHKPLNQHDSMQDAVLLVMCTPFVNKKLTNIVQFIYKCPC